VKVSLVQMNSQDNKAGNLKTAAAMIEKTVADEAPDLIVLPEYYAYLGEGRENVHRNGEFFPDGESYKLMSSLAARHRVTIHAGSVVERDGNNHYNTTLVFGPNGSEIARYRKIHLFDVDIPGGTSYRESDTISRGQDVVTYKVGDVTISDSPSCSGSYATRVPT